MPTDTPDPTARASAAASAGPAAAQPAPTQLADDAASHQNEKPHTSDTAQKPRLERQEAFLRLFVEHGTILGASEASGISRETVYAWQRQDAEGFVARFQVARDTFADTLERKAFWRIEHPEGNRGGDVLLITMLNAHLPDKYRPNAVVSDETARETLRALREAAKAPKPSPADAERTFLDTLPTP